MNSYKKVLSKNSLKALRITLNCKEMIGNIPTTFLASDYLGNYEEAKKVIDAIYQAD